jgi:hypothetical protein
MIIIDRTVAAFSAVASNPIMHQRHRAMTEPFRSRKKLKPSTSAPGTGLQIVSWFIGEPPVCAGSCGRGSIFPARKFATVRECPDCGVGFVLERLYGFAPVEVGTINVQRGFKIVHVIAKGDPLSNRPGSSTPGIGGGGGSMKAGMCVAFGFVMCRPSRC